MGTQRPARVTRPWFLLVGIVAILASPGPAAARDLWCYTDCKVSVEVTGNHAQFSISIAGGYGPAYLRLDLGTEAPVNGQFTKRAFREERVGRTTFWRPYLRDLKSDTVYYYVVTIHEDLPVVGGPTPHSYKVGAFVTHRLRFNFRIDTLDVIDDSDELSDGDLGFRIIIHDSINSHRVAEWTLRYGENRLGSGETVRLNPPLQFDHFVVERANVDPFRYRIEVTACDSDCEDCKVPITTCLAQPSWQGYDHGRGEQWIEFKGPAATRAIELYGDNPGYQGGGLDSQPVKFKVTGLARIDWVAPSKAVPDVSQLQQIRLRPVPRGTQQ
jgi:hypothetical protein